MSKMESSCANVAAHVNKSVEKILSPSDLGCANETLIPESEGQPSIIFRVRRRRRPKTSIAALFLRMSRSGGIGKRQKQVEEPSDSSSNKGPPGDEIGSEEDELKPETVTPPKYADILKARHAMIQMQSKPIWPVFVHRPKLPSATLPIIRDLRSVSTFIACDSFSERFFSFSIRFTNKKVNVYLWCMNIVFS